jgi:signal peptidase I
MGARSARRRVLRSVLQVAAAAVVALTTRASFADHYRVPSGSMEPTVLTGDRIVVNKAAYGLRVPLSEHWLVAYAEPARGDVVVLVADDPTVLLKRVVAVSGDLVEVKDGRVFLDGAVVPEPKANLESGGGPDFGPVRVPAGKVLVLGDNRGNSRDGRTFGLVDRSQILGRAAAVVAREGAPTYDPL